MNEPLYFEHKIAERLGLSRRDAKYLRDELLEKEVGWTYTGREITLSQTGLGAILDRVRASSNDLPPLEIADFSPDLVPVPQEKKGPPDGTVLLKVHRLFANPRLLQAKNAAGDIVVVRVKTNIKFKPLMELHGRPDGTGKYVMEGRCPRFRGRY